MKYYDITFHELSGKNVIKRSVPSDKANFDACVAIDQEFLQILVNGNAVSLNRRYIVRIDCQEVEDPTEKAITTKDELAGVINTLSNMGF
ncbi:hypothetical protein ABE867_11825 [Enterococcus gallinarum]|uniref:hypothetical protein n=1 Tax=Enterococcus gallinarum TaxID=1353 RepID=UPI003D6A9886